MAYIKILIPLFICFPMNLLKAQNLDTLRKKFSRVEQAAANQQEKLKNLCHQKGLHLPLQNIFIRMYKEEQILEVWGRNKGQWQLIHAYSVCIVPGKLGPKIRQGDRQVPEGWYFIDSINPQSDFHLSLRINYPNQVDRWRSRNEKDPGGDIFIHGECFSVGCIPIQNGPIEEVFWLVVQTLFAFPQTPVQVFILPFDVSDEHKYEKFKALYHEWTPFWEQLKSIQLYFNELGELPNIVEDESGNYNIDF